ncbi:MAG: hypothetical protein ABIE25_02240 [Thermoplasmatota archaeon]|nr:hypothetical protein [Candidatus Thermoplasmatota archaeon]
MDGFLALIVALVVFALFIFIIQRTVKGFVLIGLVLLTIIALRTFGVLG